MATVREKRELLKVEAEVRVIREKKQEKINLKSVGI
jgi:hypothetical protein